MPHTNVHYLIPSPLNVKLTLNGGKLNISICRRPLTAALVYLVWRLVLINNKRPYTSCVLHGVPESYRPIPSSKTLTFKMRPSAQPFFWKRVLFVREYHFDIKGWSLNLVLIQRLGELGNGLLVDGSQFPESPQPRSRSFPSQHLASTCIYLPVI